MDAKKLKLSLTDACLKIICQYIQEILESTIEEILSEPLIKRKKNKNLFNELSLKFTDNVFLPSNVSDELIHSLSKNGILNDQVITLFSDSKITNLKYVRIPDASKLTEDGLRVLKKHELKKLQLNNFRINSSTNICKFLNAWTTNELEILNVSRTSLRFLTVSYEQFENLHELDVSGTIFNSNDLNLVSNCLPNLESLNISQTDVNNIVPLQNCKHRLKKLSMYDLLDLESDEWKSYINTLVVLSELRHLDISYELHYEIRKNLVILDYPNHFPHLISLDVSCNEYFNETDMLRFIDAHPNLKFLGIFGSNLSESRIINSYSDYLKLTGTSSIEKVIFSLSLYSKRCTYVKECFSYFYEYSKKKNSDFVVRIIQIIIEVMNDDWKLDLRTLGVACLCNLTKVIWSDKSTYDSESPTNLMREVIECILNGMEMFPRHLPFQKNSLLTLCNFRLIDDVQFNFIKCAKLVFKAFSVFNSEIIDRLCVVILSVVVSRMSLEDSLKIGSCTSHIKKLLCIIEQKLYRFIADKTVFYSLTTLWNLTDESPVRCNVFVDLKGLELYYKLYNEFNDSDIIVVQILGTLSNIAEVPALKKLLMENEMFEIIRELLNSRNAEISYFSACTLAHLLLDNEENWIAINVNKFSVLNELGERVKQWQQTDNEFVAYRTFRSFVPMLLSYNMYQIQLYALWSIQHMLSANSSKYTEMLKIEGILKITKILAYNEEACNEVRELASVILNQLK